MTGPQIKFSMREKLEGISPIGSDRGEHGLTVVNNKMIVSYISFDHVCRMTYSTAILTVGLQYVYTSGLDLISCMVTDHY